MKFVRRHEPGHVTLVTHESDLATFVAHFAKALKAVDGSRPHYVSRPGRAYRPGIGPFAEDVAVDLITREMKTARPKLYDAISCQVYRPRFTGHRVDSN